MGFLQPGGGKDIESHNMNNYNCSDSFSREEPAPGQIVSCEVKHLYSVSFDLEDGEKCVYFMSLHYFEINMLTFFLLKHVHYTMADMGN